jgi:ribonuclease HI
MIQIFADGSYNPDKKTGGYSAVIVDTEKIGFCLTITGSSSFASSATMELRAIIEGLKLVPYELEVKVYTDCQGIINIIRGTQKQREHNRKGWGELWEELRLLMSERQIRWKKVKSHTTGNKWHRMADQLARRAMREEKK